MKPFAVSNPIDYATAFVVRMLESMKEAKRTTRKQHSLGWKGPFVGK